MLYSGTLVCAAAAVVTLLAYLKLWSVLDLVPAAHQLSYVFGSVAVGFVVFRRGEKWRRDGQRALSRLRDYRLRHSIGDRSPQFGELTKRGTAQQITGAFIAGGLLYWASRCGSCRRSGYCC